MLPAGRLDGGDKILVATWLRQIAIDPDFIDCRHQGLEIGGCRQLVLTPDIAPLVIKKIKAIQVLPQPQVLEQRSAQAQSWQPVLHVLPRQFSTWQANRFVPTLLIGASLAVRYDDTEIAFDQFVDRGNILVQRQDVAFFFQALISVESRGGAIVFQIGSHLELARSTRLLLLPGHGGIEGCRIDGDFTFATDVGGQFQREAVGVVQFARGIAVERVTLEAVWTVRQAGRAIASRRFSATEAIAAPTFEALASAHGRLVDALAAEIAGALP